MNIVINRRSVIRLSSAAVAVFSHGESLFAQVASPAAHSHEENPSRPTPEIAVALNDSEVIFPIEVVAGINKVVFENQTDSEAHLLTFRLPDDVDMDALMSMFSEEDAPFPEYLRDQYFPGIPDYPAFGQSQTGWINYMPGQYVAVNIFGGQTPAVFTVSGDPWGVSPPMSQQEIGMGEMTFLGLEDQVSAGKQVWSVVNHGATWHEIMVISLPNMMSPDELLEFILSTEGPDDMANAGYLQIAGSGIMSPGVQLWLEFDLAPGAYGAACFAPDDFSGPPHALSGMISTFEVI